MPRLQKRGYRKRFRRPPKGQRLWKVKVVAIQDVPSSIVKPMTTSAEQTGSGKNSEPNLGKATHEEFYGLMAMSNRLVVLQQLGFDVEVYFSCEIDKKALAIQKYNHHNMITQLGSVTDLTTEKLDSLGRIDLLIGGSPCADLSLVNHRRRGLYDPDSSGILFFEYKRIKDYYTASGNSFFWLFENTHAMEKSTLHAISDHLQCQPIKMCASSFVPMTRLRYFWGNIPFMGTRSPQPGMQQPLQNFLKPYRRAAVKLLPTLTSTSHSQLSGRMKTYPVLEEGQESLLFISEQAKLFGFPEHYTAGNHLISSCDQRRLFGKAWSIHVVKFILEPLTDLFILI